MGENPSSKLVQRPFQLRAAYNTDMTLEESIDLLQEIAKQYPSLGTKGGYPKAGKAFGTWMDALRYIFVKGKIPYKREQFLHMMKAQQVNDVANVMIDFLTAHDALVLRYFTSPEAKEKLAKAVKES